MKKTKILVWAIISVMLFSNIFVASASLERSFVTYTVSYSGVAQDSPHAFSPVLQVKTFGDITLNEPKDITSDPDSGDIYIADTNNNRIVILDKNFGFKHIIRRFESGDQATPPEYLSSASSQSGNSDNDNDNDGDEDDDYIPFQIYDPDDDDGEFFDPFADLDDEWNDLSFGNDTFNTPTGIYLHTNEEGHGYIYVCDTEKNRIVVFDKDDWSFVKVIWSPDPGTVPGEFEFKPLKMAIDMTGRLNVISENTNSGVVTMDESGKFEGFMGALRTQLSPSDIFWRTFQSEEQRRGRGRVTPATPTGIGVDKDGFIYVTSYPSDRGRIYSLINSRSNSNVFSPVKKFSPGGEDILVRNGPFQPVGEIVFYGHTDPSHLADVVIAGNNIYSVMDKRHHKIFTYDSEGNLLYAFGGQGTTLGNFAALAAIEYIDNDNSILALDSQNSSITLFEKTEYGKLIDEAINMTESKDLEETEAIWLNLRAQNSNFDLAYIGIGKVKLKEKNYSEAMDNFYAANNRLYYSRAFQNYRKELMEGWGVLIPLVIILLTVLITWGFKSAFKFNKDRKTLDSAQKKTLKEQMVYIFHVIFHPFDGFWDLKNERRGGPMAGSIILTIIAASYMISDVLTGYLFGGDFNQINIMGSLGMVFVPVVLWTVGSWCLTSLMDGKGRLVEIYTATCYAASPLMFFIIPASVLTRILITEEAMIIELMMTLGTFWVVCLIYGSTVSTHSYTAGKSFMVCLLTIVVIIFMIFLFLLFFNVISRFMTYIQEIYREVTFRL
ncbi:MAG: YIP1 family protein [Oscillospiraceae bacterium]|nr:YIP1 family protein [Oscillospiraceae bacterium]